jgi:hypothetical protein
VGGKYRFHLQVQRISQARNKREAVARLFLRFVDRVSTHPRRFIPLDRTLYNHWITNGFGAIGRMK